MPERQLYTIAQAAYALGLTETAPWMRLRRGTFRSAVHDEFRALRISAEAIDAYVQRLQASRAQVTKATR